MDCVSRCGCPTGRGRVKILVQEIQMMRMTKVSLKGQIALLFVTDHISMVSRRLVTRISSSWTRRPRKIDSHHRLFLYEFYESSKMILPTIRGT